VSHNECMVCLDTLYRLRSPSLPPYPTLFLPFSLLPPYLTLFLPTPLFFLPPLLSTPLFILTLLFLPTPSFLLSFLILFLFPSLPPVPLVTGSQA